MIGCLAEAPKLNTGFTSAVTAVTLVAFDVDTTPNNKFVDSDLVSLLPNAVDPNAGDSPNLKVDAVDESVVSFFVVLFDSVLSG